MATKPSISYVEPPPKQYLTGPISSTYLYLDDPNAMCSAVLGAIPSKGKEASSKYQGCYIPTSDLIVLPNQNDSMSDRSYLALKTHEEAHARGWRHGED